MTKENRVLSLPEVDGLEYEHNFIKTAVCELRFPALLEYETKPPIELQKIIRKEFPIYEQGNIGVITGAEGSINSEKRYLFSSKKRSWTVAFRSSSISLETTSYTHFHDFLDRLTWLLKKSQPLLDSDFFTRVGLRYVNEIPIEDGDLVGWINSDLVGPLSEGVYGSVDSIGQKISGKMKEGRYTFRHGLFASESTNTPIYGLDYDFYKEDVPFDAVSDLITRFNRESFRFFRWAIGHKAIDRMGKERPVEGLS